MEIKKLLRSSLGLSLLVLSTSGEIRAEDWPTFRGADRTAVSSETNLLDSWGSDGPELVWTASGAGKGYASPAVSNGRIYTLGDAPSSTDDGDEYLTCFNASDGQQVWKTKTGPAWNEHGGRSSWNGARGTPTIDGDHVYVISPFGKLLCASTKDGSVVWEKDLKEEFSGKKKDQWGYSESPLVDGKLLLCTPGGEKSTVVALDKMTGETVWSCERPGDVGAGHSSVVISNVGGRKVYVQNTGGGPMGIAADTGELLWSYDVAPPTAFIPSPIIDGDLVYSVAGYNLGGALLQQVPGAGGSVSVKEIYGVKKDLANKHGGVVLIDGKLYGGSEDRPLFVCADLKSGEVKWRERVDDASGSISVAAADGKLVLRSQDGAVILVKVNPEEYVPVSRFKTPGSGDGDTPSWAHPVIANGKLLLREDDAILCYDISK